jgi:hypothetical protein
VTLGSKFEDVGDDKRREHGQHYDGFRPARHAQKSSRDGVKLSSF